MALDRSQITAPVLPKKTVPFEPLGGEVIVRGMLLAEQFANTARQASEREPRPGETEGEALARANGAMAARILSQAVIDPQGNSLLTIDEWNAFGVTHPAEVFELASTAMALSGRDHAAAEKN